MKAVTFHLSPTLCPSAAGCSPSSLFFFFFFWGGGGGGGVYPSLQLSWVFEYDCLDICCFGVSYMHVFCIFVVAPVQHS